MLANAFFTWLKSLSDALTFTSARIRNQVSEKYFPHPLLILLSRVTDLTLSVVKVEGLTRKYTSMAFTHQLASSVSLEKISGRASLTVLVLVVVDMGFIDGGCYDFFPLPRLFPHLCSTTPLLLFCSFLSRDRSILTRFPILFFSSCTSSLVLLCSTGLSHSLVTSLMVTTFPLPSTQFYDFLLR